MCPESPAWHLKKGERYDLAYRSLKILRNTDLQAAKELYSIYLQRRAKSSIAPTQGSYIQKIGELFSVPRIRRATTASYAVMLSQQLCGINIIAFVSFELLATLLSQYAVCSSMINLIVEDCTTQTLWFARNLTGTQYSSYHFLRRRLLKIRRSTRVYHLRLRQLCGSLSGGLDHGHTRSSLAVASHTTLHGFDYAASWSKLQHPNRVSGAFQLACNANISVLLDLLTWHGSCAKCILSRDLSTVSSRGRHEFCRFDSKFLGSGPVPHFSSNPNSTWITRSFRAICVPERGGVSACVLVPA